MDPALNRCLLGLNAYWRTHRQLDILQLNVQVLSQEPLLMTGPARLARKVSFDCTVPNCPPRMLRWFIWFIRL